MGSKDFPIPPQIREQMAIEMAVIGTAPSLTVAAGMVGVAPSTMIHRRKGRNKREEEGERRQKLWLEEEQ